MLVQKTGNTKGDQLEPATQAQNSSSPKSSSDVLASAIASSALTSSSTSQSSSAASSSVAAALSLTNRVPTIRLLTVQNSREKTTELVMRIDCGNKIIRFLAPEMSIAQFQQAFRDFLLNNQTNPDLPRCYKGISEFTLFCLEENSSKQISELRKYDPHFFIQLPTSTTEAAQTNSSAGQTKSPSSSTSKGPGRRSRTSRELSLSDELLSKTNQIAIAVLVLGIIGTYVISKLNICDIRLNRQGMDIYWCK